MTKLYVVRSSNPNATHDTTNWYDEATQQEIDEESGVIELRKQRDALLDAVKLLVTPLVPWQLSKGAKIYGVLQNHDTTLALDYADIHNALRKAVALIDPKAVGE